MLANLRRMLDEQGFEDVILFKDDHIGLEYRNHFELLARTHQEDRFEKPCFQFKESPTIPNVRDVFFPSFCIQKKCVLGCAVHPKKGRLVILFCGKEEAKVNKKMVKSIVQDLHDCPNLMIIVAAVLTSQAKEVLRYNSESINYQLFASEFFRTCVIEHDMVPSITHLSEEMKQHLLETKHLPATHFPKLWITDKVAKFYNPQKGDFMIVSRPSWNGHFLNVRAVVEETHEKKATKKKTKHG